MSYFRNVKYGNDVWFDSLTAIGYEQQTGNLISPALARKTHFI